VFKVFAFGDIDITYPASAQTRKAAVDQPSDVPLSIEEILRPQRAIVRNEYARDRAGGFVDGSTTEAQYCWEKIANSPEKYLRTSGARETGGPKMVPYKTGSCFAVNREGIILTNAHVITAPTKEILSDPDSALWLLESPITQTLSDLELEFGEKPAESVLARLVGGLLDLFRAQSELTGDSRFVEARIALNVRSKESPLAALLRKIQGLPEEKSPLEKLRDETTPAEVVRQGQPFPGKDVAILKVPITNRLICLPLGDSKEVYAGRTVQALGFPSAALNPGQAKEAEFRVISHNGQVDQTLPMLDHWEAFHLTAEISPGDSGGPVVDEYGNVIAMNVAGNPNVPAQNVAIPINIAKELLQEANIKLDAGPVTDHWLKGQDAFWRGRRAAALDEFRTVAALQKRNPELLPEFSNTVEDPYVAEMILKCQASARSSN
jgi:S1-C subfamily serine protease